jgi:uncharacterized protein involved in exopolysaccharide biosynthesis
VKELPVRDEGRTTSAYDEPDLLREQFRQLLRYRLLITLGVLLGLAGGSYLGLATNDTYIASSEIVVRAPASDPFGGGTLDRVAMGSERRTAISDTVAVRAAADLGLPEEEADELQRGLQVTNPPNTEVLRFSYTASDPETAAGHANAFVAAYLGNRQDTADGLVETMVGSLLEERAELQERLAEQDDKLDELFEGGRAYDRALTARDQIAGRIGGGLELGDCFAPFAIKQGGDGQRRRDALSGDQSAALHERTAAPGSEAGAGADGRNENRSH